MQCGRCGQIMQSGEEHQHAGQLLCDDCYMDALSPAKACDPWAVYTATRLGHQELNPRQETILDLLRQKGMERPEKLMQATGLDAKALERELAALRHLELIRGARGPDGERYIKLFSDKD
jgi:predicted transcriptional regulator